MDDRLALSVTHADGTTTRWGPDEPDAANALDDLTFGTSTPGGFRDLNGALLRDLKRANSDQRLFDDVLVYGAGRRIAWEGRTTQFPYADGVMHPGAVGHAAHLKDDRSLVEVYVDRDQSHWGDAPLNEKIRAATAGQDFNGAMSFATDLGGVVCSIPNQAFPAAAQAGTAWYQGPAGVVIAKAMYNGAVTTLPAGWSHGFYFCTTDSVVTFTLVTPTLDGTLRTATPAPTRGQYMGIYLFSASTALTPAAGSQVRYTKLAVYGNHGLTTRANGAEPDGLYIPDMVRNIVQRWAPNLSIGTIDVDTFVCPHAVFADPTDAETAISYLNAFLLWDWLVYDNKTFDFRAPDPTRLTWSARRDRGARLSLTGDDAENQYNGVLVTYQDALGQKRIAGPPATYWQGGVARADSTNAALVDTTTTNPVNAAGIPRRWGLLELSFPTTASGAEQIGIAWLAEHALPQRRGEITLQGVGSVVHPTQGELPTWCVRAGDYISVGDINNDTPRRIISTTYAHSNRTLTAQLDNTSSKLDAILERIGVGLVGVL